MGIVSERNVFTTLNTRYGKSLCYGRLSYTYDEVLFIFSITNLQYRVATAKSFVIAGVGGAGCWEMCYHGYTIIAVLCGAVFTQSLRNYMHQLYKF